MSFGVVEELSPQYLIARINDIISIDVLSLITSDPNKLIFEILPKAVEKILNEVKSQLIEILKWHGAADYSVYNRFISESSYKSIIMDYMNGITDYIKEVPGYITPHNMKSYLKSIAVEESDKLKRSLISEHIIASNWGRSEYYKEIDPNNRGRYKWAVFFDNRTSRQCKEIQKRQNLPEGLPLEQLRKLLHDVASEYEPNYTWRDWNPHFYCRSTLVKVF